MSTLNTMLPFVSAPWLDADGNPLSVRPQPGLRAEVIQSLECSYPGILSPPMKALLGTCCGLADTALGNIDFTGCWFMEEPDAVFRPALTLAVDDAGRRWISEVGNRDLPGPVWCVVSNPEVTLYVCDDLASFVATLHEHSCRGGIQAWLDDLNDQAQTVWSQRHARALRPHQAFGSDRTIRGWLSGLPFNAYVYDLRERNVARGWPHGVAGPLGRVFRCGRMPVFAVAGSPGEGWRAPYPTRRAAPIPGIPTGELPFAIDASRSGRTRRPIRRNPRQPLVSRRASCHSRKPPLEIRSGVRTFCANAPASAGAYS
jgi:hypothetical protein